MIKKILFGAAALALAVIPVSGAIAKDRANDICPLMAITAKNAMAFRQHNRSISEYINRHIDVIDRSGLPDKAKEGMKTLVRIYAVEAYEMPVFITPEVRDRAIEQFANDKEAECYKIIFSDTI
jgi:hypothetical protein